MRCGLFNCPAISSVTIHCSCIICQWQELLSRLIHYSGWMAVQGFFRPWAHIQPLHHCLDHCSCHRGAVLTLWPSLPHPPPIQHTLIRAWVPRTASSSEWGLFMNKLCMLSVSYQYLGGVHSKTAQGSMNYLFERLHLFLVSVNHHSLNPSCFQDPGDSLDLCSIYHPKQVPEVIHPQSSKCQRSGGEAVMRTMFELVF